MQFIELTWTGNKYPFSQIQSAQCISRKAAIRSKALKVSTGPRSQETRSVRKMAASRASQWCKLWTRRATRVSTRRSKIMSLWNKVCILSSLCYKDRLRRQRGEAWLYLITSYQTAKSRYWTCWASKTCQRSPCKRFQSWISTFTLCSSKARASPTYQCRRSKRTTITQNIQVKSEQLFQASSL